MNKKQQHYLEKIGYYVLPDLNFFILKNQRDGKSIPAIDLCFDSVLDKFGIKINCNIIPANYIHSFQNMVTEKSLIAMELNSLSDDKKK